MSSGYIPDVVQPNPSTLSRGGSFDLSIHFHGTPPSGNTTVNLTYQAWETGNSSHSIDPSTVLDNPPSSVVASPTENPKVITIATLSNAPVPTTVQITASANTGSSSGNVNVTS